MNDGCLDFSKLYSGYLNMCWMDAGCVVDALIISHTFVCSLVEPVTLLAHSFILAG